jgi:hypothetical protein
MPYIARVAWRFFKVHHPGHLGLHAEGEFVAFEARIEFGMVRAAGAMEAVELLPEAEISRLARRGHAGRRGHVENRRALRPQRRALIVGG